MIGRTISHYKILEKLGEGGMGVVYKAQDTKLDRIVALKFLPKHLLCDSEAKTRFEHEAKAASALDHPNICNIHEIDEVEGECFISMAYVEGESIKDLLKEKTLAFKEILDIAIQIAEGLNVAHKKGIVHRDIKSDNLMLTNDGLVKIMDFGLAKLRGASKVTKTGSTLGTVAYMSPEQARGEEVDARTDIWSLGVVMYEMITGRLPFRSEYEQALVYSILHEEPQSVISLRAETPPQLERTVRKTLEKDKSKRYQKVQDILFDLKKSTLTDIQAQKQEKSIVVLPFENLSPDPDQEYFSDGLTEEVISDLSKVRALRVISRSSAMTFKGTKKKVPEIARELNVQYVLEGSVRKANNSLRIAAQLIDAESDAHLWAEKYSGTLDDVFEIQEKVSHSIVDALRLQLTPLEAERLTEHSIPNALSYEFYIKARQEILKWTEAGLENALRYLQRGLEIVGENALLYAGMAYVFCQYFNLGFKEEEYCRKEAEGYLNKAFSLDPQCSYANFVQGLLLAPSKPREAIIYFKRVLETNPNDFDTLFYLSCLLGTLGQIKVVIPLEEKTIRIDPLNPAAHFHSGFNRLWEGKYELAVEILRKLHQSFPEDLLTQWAYGLSLAYTDKREEARFIFDQIAQEQRGGFFAEMSLALKYALEGKRSETLRVLDSNPQLRKTNDCQYAYWIAECYALIDEKERALDWLERDVDLGMINYPLMSELDPFLKNIRKEERFKKLMERVKFEWEHFEV